MNKTQNNIILLLSRKRRRGSWTAALLTLLAACMFAAGCASKSVEPAAGPAAPGANAALTPEQEAAKQHGMQMGVAMQAARDAAAKKANTGQ